MQLCSKGSRLNRRARDLFVEKIFDFRICPHFSRADVYGCRSSLYKACRIVDVFGAARTAVIDKACILNDLLQPASTDFSPRPFSVYRTARTHARTHIHTHTRTHTHTHTHTHNLRASAQFKAHVNKGTHLSHFEHTRVSVKPSSRQPVAAGAAPAQVAKSTSNSHADASGRKACWRGIACRIWRSRKPHTHTVRILICAGTF